MNAYYNARIIIYNTTQSTQSMADLKHLVSPFVLVPSGAMPTTATIATTARTARTPRPAPPCNCDSDEENDFGMAPECAFICALSARSHTTSKKRNTGKGHRAKKTRRNNNINH